MSSLRTSSALNGVSGLVVLLAALGLLLLSPAHSEATCGEKNCIGEDACKDDNIGTNCPTGPGSFCLITCNGKSSCSGSAKFKPASESGHIICDGEDACKDAKIRLQGGAVTSQWKRTCTGSGACESMSTGGVGTCSGGSCPTCSACGDGNVSGGEACDDGDTDNGDGCSSTCSVESGWDCSSGTCVDVNGCSLDGGSGCGGDANASCTDQGTDSRTCTCGAGYSGTATLTDAQNFAGCNDIDECTASTDNCDANATCTNVDGGFTCSCDAGYTGSGTSCSDVDECATNNGGCDALTTCTNTAGSRTCSACPSGYNGDGVNGCNDIDECSTEVPSQVQPIGSWQDGDIAGYAHAAPAGANRVLLVFGHSEANAAPTDFSAISYGGQALTQVVQQLQNQSSSYSATAEIWILDEAGIEAATGSTIVATTTGAVETRRISSAFYAGVDQADPTGQTGTAGQNANGTQILSVALSGLELDAGDMVVANNTVRNDQSGDTSWTWQNGFAAIGSYNPTGNPYLAYSDAEVVADGTAETATVTILNNGVGALAVMVLNHGATVNNGGCGDAAYYTCTNTGGGFTCADIDECTTNNGDCDALTSCTNNIGAAPTCGDCPSGYSGDGVNGCADINECSTNNGDCDGLTTCTNSAGSFTCGACPSGYTGDGASGCNDVNECSTNNGDCDSLTTCSNTAGSFSCGACPSGYTGDGASGCNDVNECSTNTDNCDANATCTNTTGGFTCACAAGFTGDGTTCTDVNECSANTDNCDANATWHQYHRRLHLRLRGRLHRRRNDLHRCERVLGQHRRLRRQRHLHQYHRQLHLRLRIRLHGRRHQLHRRERVLGQHRQLRRQRHLHQYHRQLHLRLRGGLQRRRNDLHRRQRVYRQHRRL